MYLKRKMDSCLMEWKAAPNHKPLIVRGARQIGKTESILNFANAEYESVININFVEEPKYRTITGEGYRAEDIVRNISRIDPTKRFIEGKTLIFFDEFQEHPDIATALKFFHIDGRFDVVCSGSLLGTHYKRIESNSVGYKMEHLMHSLDFEEFLWAKGYDESIAQEMLGHMIERRPFSSAEMSVFSSLFLDFCILGGMPAVVREYIQSGTFEGTLDIQRQLIADYREDVRKYADGLDQTRILNVFDQIPIQLAKDNKKFQISKVAKGARFRDYRGCIEWLKEAGVINICRCLGFPELPLKGNCEEDKYKIYLADTGLLVAMLDDEAQEDLRANKNLGVYKGALYENIAAEALVKSGGELYYYKREDSTLEQDFFMRTRDSLLPVEVKARDGKAKSMKTLISSDKYPDVKSGVKLFAGNIGYENGVYSFPLFTAFLLRRWAKENITHNL